MTIFEIILTAIALSMDAFAVSICKGISLKKINLRNCVLIGTYFGLFQALMPIIGYLLGHNFKDLIMSIDHWIAFILLLSIGINMILESSKEEILDNKEKLSFKVMIVLAIATSIDALAVGITFAFLDVDIIGSSLIIGIITFTLSILGAKFGNVFGNKLEKRAQVLGGIILIMIGLKILIEHLYL